MVTLLSLRQQKFRKNHGFCLGSSCLIYLFILRWQLKHLEFKFLSVRVTTWDRVLLQESVSTCRVGQQRPHLSGEKPVCGTLYLSADSIRQLHQFQRNHSLSHVQHWVSNCHEGREEIKMPSKGNCMALKFYLNEATECGKISKSIRKPKCVIWRHLGWQKHR